MKTIFLRFVVAGLCAAALVGCSKKHDHSGHDHSGHNHAAEKSGAHKHEHKPPHGGTAVVLGKEQFHLELVRDAAAGTLTAYVFDGEFEKFIRVGAPAISLVATANGQAHPLVLKAVENSATGEKVGDSSQFVAQADWLKTTAEFDAVLATIEVKGAAFAGVAFNFPKGNEGH